MRSTATLFITTIIEILLRISLARLETQSNLASGRMFLKYVEQCHR